MERGPASLNIITEQITSLKSSNLNVLLNRNWERHESMFVYCLEQLKSQDKFDLANDVMAAMLTAIFKVPMLQGRMKHPCYLWAIF
jgi:hypothetical protein